MPGCAAVGCVNSARKGFLMKKFPKDPVRRKEWAFETKRDKWVPTDSSVLCEAHFKPDMWERTREDGSRRLKANAIPTIFPFTRGQSKQKALDERIQQLISPEMQIGLCQDYPILVPSENCCSQKVEPLDFSSEEATSLIVNSTSDSMSSHEKTVFRTLSEQEQLNMYSELYKRKSCSLRVYRNKLRCAELKIKHLQQELTENKSETSGLLHKLFNEDQVLALKKKNNGKSTKYMKWSNETITKAFELMLSCGSKGYQKLLDHNLPYPSIRTLQRRLQN